MRGKKIGRLVLLLAAVWLSGCGTVCNLTGREPEIYGGLGKDFEFASKPRFNVADKGGGGIVMGLWLAEVCASGVGDTLTIPVVLYRQAKMDYIDRSLPMHSPEAENSKVDRSGPVQYTAGAAASSAP